MGLKAGREWAEPLRQIVREGMVGEPVAKFGQQTIRFFRLASLLQTPNFGDPILG